MKVYDFDDYKTYIKAWIKELPKGGRGELRRIANPPRGEHDYGEPGL